MLVNRKASGADGLDGLQARTGQTGQLTSQAKPQMISHHLIDPYHNSPEALAWRAKCTSMAQGINLGWDVSN